MMTWPPDTRQSEPPWWHAVLWAICLPLALVASSCWRLRLLWRQIGLVFAASFIGWGVALYVLLKRVDPQVNNNPVDLAYLTQWWSRLKPFGVTYILPHAWTTHSTITDLVPSDQQVVTVFWHVALAGALITTIPLICLLVCGVIVHTLTRADAPQ